MSIEEAMKGRLLLRTGSGQTAPNSRLRVRLSNNGGKLRSLTSVSTTHFYNLNFYNFNLFTRGGERDLHVETIGSQN